MAAEQPQPVSILFTQDLRGDLRFLPKLARRLMQLRLEDQRTLTLDLGGSCSPEAWHCAVTEGRSMLIGLDGLNYTAVNAEHLSEQVRPHLMKSLVNMQVVSATRPGAISGARFYTRLPVALVPDDGLLLLLTPGETASVQGNVVRFPAVERYTIGRLRVLTGATNELVSVEMFDVPPETPPDGTISGMVDFIEGEARFYQRRGQK